MFGEFTTEATQETHSLREHCLDPKMCLAWILLVPLFRYASRLFCFAPSPALSPASFPPPPFHLPGSPIPTTIPDPLSPPWNRREGRQNKCDNIMNWRSRISHKPALSPTLRIGAECNRNPHLSATGTNILLLSLCCFFSFPHLLINP